MSPKTHSPFLALLLIASLLLAGCNLGTASPTPLIPPERPEATSTAPVSTPTAEPTPEPPRTLAICLGAEPASLYPLGAPGLAARQVLQAIYDGPIDGRNYSYQPVILQKLPSLADGDAVLTPVTVGLGQTVQAADGQVVSLANGVRVRPAGCQDDSCAILYDGVSELQMDQLSAQFALLAGLLWADGAPLTAADSVYAYQLAADPVNAAAQNQYVQARTQAYTALDERSLVWTGIPGYLDPAYFLNFWSPLPQHLWGAFTPADLAGSPLANETPLGWGAYQVRQWVRGSHLELVRNPNYFRAAEGLPAFDTLVFNFLGEGGGLEALRNGECDLLDWSALQNLSAADLLAAQADLQLLFSADGAAWEHLDFNQRPVESLRNNGAFAGWDLDGDGLGPFGDVRLRQALAQCLDRPAAIQSALAGLSEPLNSFLPAAHPLYNPEAAAWTYDPQAAGELLDETGWRDTNNDGWREAVGVTGVPDATPLAFDYLVTDSPVPLAAAEALSTSLAACGVQVRLQPTAAEALFQEGPDGRVFGRTFDAVQFAWLSGGDPFCRLYLTENIPGPAELSQSSGAPVHALGWGGINPGGYANPAFDAACLLASQSLPGQAAYAGAWAEVQALFAQELPAVPLYQRYRAAAARADLCGLALDALESAELWSLESIDFGEGCETP